jgi:dolichol-phosphate mannosyltransferase
VKLLGIVVLAFNETFSLRKTLESLVQLLDVDDTEIIIATSHKASDSCKRTALDLAAKYQNVSIHFQTRPYVAAAVLESVEKLRTHFVVYMSSDGETPPEMIPKMLTTIRGKDVDIVAASRWIQGGSFIGYGFIKYKVSWAAQQLCRVLYSKNIREYTYGFRIYKRQIMLNCKFSEPKHPFFLETLLVPLRLGYKISEIPVNWVPRTEGNSVVNASTLISYIRPIVRVRLTKKSRLSLLGI